MNVELLAHHDVELSTPKRRRLLSWLQESIPFEEKRIDLVEVRLSKPAPHSFACHLDTTLIPSHHVHVEGQGMELDEALHQAVDRLRRKLHRELERRRSLRQRAQQEAER